MKRWLLLLLAFLCMGLATAADAEKPVRGVIQMCSACPSRRLPELRKFIKEAVGGQYGQQMTVEAARTDKPILVVYGPFDTMIGRFTLQEPTAAKLHELLQNLGFTRVSQHPAALGPLGTYNAWASFNSDVGSSGDPLLAAAGNSYYNSNYNAGGYNNLAAAYNNAALGFNAGAGGAAQYLNSMGGMGYQAGSGQYYGGLGLDFGGNSGAAASYNPGAAYYPSAGNSATATYSPGVNYGPAYFSGNTLSGAYPATGANTLQQPTAMPAASGGSYSSSMSSGSWNPQLDASFGAGGVGGAGGVYTSTPTALVGGSGSSSSSQIGLDNPAYQPMPAATGLGAWGSSSSSSSVGSSGTANAQQQQFGGSGTAAAAAPVQASISSSNSLSSLGMYAQATNTAAGGDSSLVGSGGSSSSLGSSFGLGGAGGLGAGGLAGFAGGMGGGGGSMGAMSSGLGSFGFDLGAAAGAGSGGYGSSSSLLGSSSSSSGDSKRPHLIGITGLGRRRRVSRRRAAA